MADIIAVSALNKYVRSVLESDTVINDIAIRGEIVNFTCNSSTGHCYFSLRDEKASVRAVMFRKSAQSASFTPANGMEVVVRGRISLYERDGTFQIIVEFIFLDGTGATQAAFAKLKEKLEAEGLFASEHKKSIPAWPREVGLITSKTGAALQDILKVARQICPAACFVLAAATVQGQRAADEICAAIRALSNSGRVDVIIVARGGGSAEDLYVFNSEQIAREAFNCDVPIVSAIGHETDFTILDFVADLRAPTPSAAAQMVLPDVRVLLARMMHLFANIANNMQVLMDSCYNNLERLAMHQAFTLVNKACAMKGARLGEVSQALVRAKEQRLEDAKASLKSAAALAAGLSPYAVLARGYAMVQAESTLISSVKQAKADSDVDVILRDGVLNCHIKRIEIKQIELQNE